MQLPGVLLERTVAPCQYHFQVHTCEDKRTKKMPLAEPEATGILTTVTPGSAPPCLWYSASGIHSSPNNSEEE